MPAEEEWPEPKVIAREASGRPFPLESGLPLAMQAFAQAVSEHLQVDVAAVGAAMPVVLSAAAGNAFSVTVNSAGHTEPCLSRYVLISARPGERKSATFKWTTSPLQAWVEEALPKWKQDCKDVDSANDLYMEVARSLKRKVSKAGPDGAADLLAQVLKCESQIKAKPRRPCLCLSDLTSPALVRAMASNGGGLAVFSGEARQVLDQMLGEIWSRVVDRI